MKLITIIISVFLLCSCSTTPEYTGQQFSEDSPDFYLSIAPSFDKPYEYEIHDTTLVLREYSGLGGYDWGRKNLVAKVTVTLKEQEKIRRLTFKAIADTIHIEEERRKRGELVVVADGTSWYIQSGIVPFLSIRTNNIESNAFGELKSHLDFILKRGSNDA